MGSEDEGGEGGDDGEAFHGSLVLWLIVAIDNL